MTYVLLFSISNTSSIMLIPCLKAPNNIYHTYDKYFSFGGISNIPFKGVSSHWLFQPHFLPCLESHYTVQYHRRCISHTSPSAFSLCAFPFVLLASQRNIYLLLARITYSYPFRLSPAFISQQDFPISTLYKQKRHVLPNFPCTAHNCHKYITF